MTLKSYKQRRIEAGYNYVGFWVTPAQEEIIKNMLTTMENHGLSPEVELMPRGGWRPRKPKDKAAD